MGLIIIRGKVKIVKIMKYVSLPELWRSMLQNFKTRIMEKCTSKLQNQNYREYMGNTFWGCN